jgi:hypothetical protein
MLVSNLSLDHKTFQCIAVPYRNVKKMSQKGWRFDYKYERLRSIHDFQHIYDTENQLR